MRTRKGFTLVELLVVIGIIALLAAILFPVFQKAMKYAHKASCTNKMHQICVAAKMYASDCDGKGPSFGDGRGPLDSLLQYTGHQIIVPATGDYDTFFYCTGAPSSHYYGSPRYSIISDLCGRASWGDFSAAPHHVVYSFEEWDYQTDNPDTSGRWLYESMLQYPWGAMRWYVRNPSSQNPNTTWGQDGDGGAAQMNGQTHGQGNNVGFVDGHVKCIAGSGW